MADHTLYHSVHLSLIHIYSHTHSYTHNILKKKKKKLVTKVQTKPKHDRYPFFAFRRQKKERHSSYCQIYNYSSLKRIKLKLNKVL